MVSKNMKVVGIGQCSLDYLFVVDSFPQYDTKKEVIEWTVSGGGPVATALVGLSRLGATCSFCGIIGDDESGEKIAESLKSEEVDTAFLLRRPRSSSQTAFIAVAKESGKRTIFWRRPSGEPLRPEEIPFHCFDNADFLLLDGLMLNASVYAAKVAREKEIPVMLDAGRVREGMKELAALCDYVVASEEFGRELIKEEHGDTLFRPEEALISLKQLGSRVCTITLGEKGSMTLLGNEMFHTPAFPVDVVDTTGAGDIFHSGYIYGLLQGWNMKDVVRFAAAFASLKCRKLGGRAGIPTLEEVQALLREKEF
jgi:ribokinase